MFTLELNFGMFCAVFAILCSIWFVGRLLLADDYVYIPERKRHHWKSIKLLSRVGIAHNSLNYS